MNSFCLYACLDIIVRLFFWLEVVCVFWLFCSCCCWRLFWVFQVVWIFGERAWCAGRGAAAPSLPLLAHFLPGTPRVQPRHMCGTTMVQPRHTVGTTVAQLRHRCGTTRGTTATHVDTPWYNWHTAGTSWYTRLFWLFRLVLFGGYYFGPYSVKCTLRRWESISKMVVAQLIRSQ